MNEKIKEEIKGYPSEGLDPEKWTQGNTIWTSRLNVLTSVERQETQPISLFKTLRNTTAKNFDLKRTDVR